MYSRINYVKRGLRFLNNKIRPGHKYLSTLMLYGTDLCDSRCKHCLIWAKRPVVHLPFEKIVEVLKSKCITKDTSVGLEGGEFLLHPEADKILEWFTKHHPNFDLLSNCLKPEKVIEAVTKYPPRRLYISLDGTEETYRFMRGKDGYGKVLRVIEECRSKVPVSVMFTLSPFNSFEDLKHVISICKKYEVDVRIGVYNDISFFDTVQKAHTTEIASLSGAMPDNISPTDRDFKGSIPLEVVSTDENYDFLLLYDEWRKRKTKLKCHSILDSLVIHPNGNVPICQNLDTKLGNIYERSLDDIFNSATSQAIQSDHVNNCNKCWINFHRKYDVILMRTLEMMLPKKIIEVFLGKYQWAENSKLTYKEFMKSQGVLM